MGDQPITPGLIAVVALDIGLLLILSGQGIRQSTGLCEGHTLNLDRRKPYSRRYGLSGRPDRIIEGSIPQESKRRRA
jgi:CRISPR-associated exonuclease Cas4